MEISDNISDKGVIFFYFENKSALGQSESCNTKYGREFRDTRRVSVVCGKRVVYYRALKFHFPSLTVRKKEKKKQIIIKTELEHKQAPLRMIKANITRATQSEESVLSVESLCIVGIYTPKIQRRPPGRITIMREDATPSVERQ